MNTENFEQWFKQGKNFTLPINELNKVTTDICRHATQEGLDILSDNVALMSDQMKRLGNVRKPEDYLNLSRECITENMNAGIATIQKMMQLSVQTLEELSQLSNTYRNTGSASIKTADKDKYDKSRN